MTRRRLAASGVATIKFYFGLRVRPMENQARSSAQSMWLFPDKAIESLRTTRWDPLASRGYDAMSGGFVWSDEIPAEAIQACVSVENWAFRFVLGYRASLIQNEPREDLRSAWEQLLQECPDWPGFRPERRAPELSIGLDAECARFERELEELDRLADENQVHCKTDSERKRGES